MDRLEAMSILARVVDTGSFSAAARELRMPLASVSRKVGELEARLGSRLLLRTTRRLALTDAGTDYLAATRRILEAVDEAERKAAGEFETPRGELVLTAPILFGRLHLLPVVSDFLAEYPEINVRLVLSDRNLQLVDEHVDLALRIGALPDSSLVATRIGQMRTVVCASPKLLSRHGVPKTPSDLIRMPCISFTMPTRLATWSFRKPGTANRPIEIEIKPRLTVSTAEAAVWAAAHDVGTVRVLHYQCIDALQAGELRVVLATHEPVPFPVHLVHAARGTLPTKMRAFLDYAAPRLRARLAEIEVTPTRSSPAASTSRRRPRG
jgi:DNA-binding transcriptional LysR family regulator